MTYILSKNGSAKFKNLVALAKNSIPNEPLDSLNNLVNILIKKKNEITDEINISRDLGKINTLNTYLDDINTIINLAEARITVLNQSVGGKRRRRKSYKKKKSYKKRRTYKKK